MNSWITEFVNGSSCLFLSFKRAKGHVLVDLGRYLAQHKWINELMNSPGLCPGRVRSLSMCSCHLPFSFLEHFLKHLQLKPTRTAISNGFFGTRAMHTNSNNISSSSCCFLFEKCAREGGCQGASGLVDSSLFASLGASFFKMMFGTFFSGKECQMDPPNSI